LNILSRLQVFGDKQAIVTDTDSMTYADLQQHCEAGAKYLLDCGVKPNDVVGLTLSNEIDHLVASLSLLHLGAKQVTLATHDPPIVRSELIKRSGVTQQIAAFREHPDDIEWCPSKIGEYFGGLPLPDGTSGTLYLKTSGTTGRLNIVPLTNEQILLQAMRHPEYADERLLRLASIEHNNSKRHRLYCVLMGGTNIFRSTVEFDVIRFCARHNVTCLDISRMHASNLAEHGGDYGLAHVKLRTGGSAIPFDVRRKILECVTPLLYVRYATTESGAISMASSDEHDEIESVGRPLPGVDLEIVSSGGTCLPVGATGHIRVRVPGMAMSYLDSPEDSKKRFKDGWFWPGDMGKINPDGRLIINGREDDMMVLNGLNIFPVEIERVLERHSAVEVAAALPIESRTHGQIPVAAVELKKGCNASAEEIQLFARERLGLRFPRRVIIMEKLPRNSQGKILKREIAMSFLPPKAHHE
jgi:long-chain acyl-CoA synthetase